MNYDLDKFGLSEEELFSPVDNSSLESEKIIAAILIIILVLLFG